VPSGHDPNRVAAIVWACVYTIAFSAIVLTIDLRGATISASSP
jgi:hypothetical protein